MALLAADLAKSYPLPVYNYRVTVLKIPVSRVWKGGSLSNLPTGAESIGFSKVSGLNMEFEPVVYKDGFSFITGASIQPGMAKEVNLTLERGIVQKGSYLYNWLAESHQPFSFVRGKRDLLVDLCDADGLPAVRWVVYGAMPTKLVAPEFSSSSGDVAIESLELIATFLKMDYSL